MTHCNVKESENLLKIGNNLPSKFLSNLSSHRMTSSASILKCFKVELNEVEYLVCINSENRITYIETRDPKFSTGDGISIGTPLHKVLKVAKSDLRTEVGWATYLQLNSGWNVAFGLEHDSSVTVQWIFKK